MTELELPLDKFKKDIKLDIDFIMEGKTSFNKERIMGLIMPKIANYSHSTFSFEDDRFKHYVGHAVRKDFRKELVRYARDYINSKEKEFKNKNGNA